jgi:uncharacterized repeat protein (TIGR01451 family)/fimbrial isopeptide formation D2 family protein
VRRHVPHRLRPVLALSAALSLVMGTTVLITGPAVAAAELTLTKSAPGSALVGADVTYTLTATNPGDQPLYNVSFRDVLPDGVRFKADSTRPTEFGDPPPTTVVDGVGNQTVIWSNVSDLQPGSTTTLTFTATVDGTLYPAGSSVTNTANVFGSTNPRQVPRFLANGTPVASPSVLRDDATASPTLITPIQVTKNESSNESELLRGVHDQVTTYTLRVENNKSFATNNTTLTDYLPASLEFLGCSGVDNTRIDPSTGQPTEEYPGSGPLGTPPAPADCVFPLSVSTVTNPTVGANTLTGVYTRLEWNTGSLSPGQVITYRYAAGVPLQANTTDWSARPGGVPSAGSGLQASNLDNNNGAPTAETGTEQTATNTARITGTYTGPFAPGGSNPVFDEDTKTVTLEDIALQKTANTPTFAANQIVTFSLRVRVSEYVDGSGIVLRDALPNGYCPLSSTTNFVDGLPLDCDPVPGSDPTGADYASVTQLPSGQFDIAFTPIDVDANGIATVTFKAKMRENYTGGSLAGTPTTSGDSFTNTSTLTGTTTGIAGTPGAGQTEEVLDSSSYTQTTDGLTLNKKIQPRLVGQNCDDNTYVGNDEINAPGFDPNTLGFRKGDRVCFELNVDFSDTAAARNVVITDIIPEGTQYEPNSQQVAGIPPEGVTFNEAAAVSGADFPTWNVGFPGASGGTAVLAGTVLRIRFSVLVTDAAPPGGIEITGNLLKMKSESSTGQARSYRDRVPFGIIPAPPVPVVKGIAAINGTAINQPPAPISPPTTGVDGRQVAEGGTVTFRVDITNGGEAEDLNAFFIRGLQVWDVLPAGITCTQIDNISAVSSAPGAPVGFCTDPGDTNQPTFPLRDTRSAITWNFRQGLAGDPDAIADGETRTLTYDMDIPTPSSIAGRYDNTAYVRSFEASTNLFNVSAEYIPPNNVDTTVDPDDYSGPPSQDDSFVVLPDAAFTKTLVSTSLNEQNNPTAGVAVNGEGVVYRIRLDVPARTSVFNGRVTDPFPSFFVRDSSSLTFFPDAASTTPGSIPSGVGFDASTGELRLNTAGNTYTNTTNTAQRFEITVEGRITPTAGAGGQNTATFDRSATPTGPLLTPARVARASVTVRIPLPTITKSNDANGEVRAGQDVVYTLRATNAINRPPVHDTVVYDCLPAGLTFSSYGTLSQGSTVPPIPGDGVNCPSTRTQLQWNVGTVLGGTTSPNAPDPGETLTYTATVDPSAAGGATYTNNASLTGSSLPNGANNGAVERVVGDTDFNEVEVISGTVVKSATPDRATIGERVEYRVQITVPADVNFYDATLLDTLPAGIDASSVQFVSASCTPGCTTNPQPVTPAALPGGATRIGWYIGNVLSDPVPRLLTIRYSAVVANNPGPSPVRGDTPENVAQPAWFTTNDPLRPRPTASTNFNVFGDSNNAIVTVLEPAITLDKGVSQAAPEPGDTFTYTVDITNGTAVEADNYSTAFNVEVVDTVPDGVVVIEPLADGVFAPDGTPANGGGTITWSLDRLGIGDTVTRTYQARLADSPALTGGSLVNTVRATEYRSLDGAGRLYQCPQCPSASAVVTPALPRLSVAKVAVGTAPAYIDEAFPWRIIVTNTGQGIAYGVDVADALPPNWEYVPGTSVITRPSGTLPEAPSGSVTAGDSRQRLTWDDVVDLLPGQSVTINLQATPGILVVGNPTVGSGVPHINDAQAVADDGAGFPGFGTPETPYRGTANAQTRIDSADVVITKSHSTPPEPAAGAPFDWTINVRNAGSDTAVGPFVVTDDLPDTIIANGTPNGPGWACTVPTASGAFTCQRTGSLASGAAFPDITVPVTTDPSTPSGTEYVNEAEVSARTYDPDLDSNIAEDTVTIRTEADVTLAKSLSGSVVAGQNATYTLEVSNDGPSTALGTITVDDTLPPGSTLVSADGGTDWSCPESSADDGVLTCTYLGNSGDLLPGATDTITVVVAIPADQSTDVVNTATVTSPTTFDPDTDNNTDTVTSTPSTSADVGITKVSRGEFIAGSPGTYRMSVTNTGPSDAQAVTFSDPLPTGLTYASFTSVDGDWTCDANPALTIVTCDLAGALTPGQTVTVDVVVDIASDVAGDIVNTATVSTATDDPNPNNDESTDTTGSRAEADVFIVKTDAPDPVIAGEQLTYTLRIGNSGPSDAQGPIVVTDDLPAGTTFVSVSPDDSGAPWSCSETSGTVTCSRTSTLPSGDNGIGDEITIVVDVDPSAGPETITNTATVDSQTTPEPVGGEDNNSSTVETTVEDDVELVLEKETTGDTTVEAGDPAGTEFTLTVTNQGPSTADNVVVTDTMPAGLVPVSADGAGWTCEDPIVGQEITCTRDELRPGTSTITVKARVAASVLDDVTLTNEATVSTTTPGDNSGNNDDSSNVAVIARADLSISKSHPDRTFLAGEDIIFTLEVSNNGFSDAQPTLTINDTLPAGFIYLSESGPWECTAEAPTNSGQEVECTLADDFVLAAKADAPPLLMRVAIDPTTDDGDYVNTAAVSSGTTDPVEDNDQARDTVTVATETELVITKSHEGPVRIGDDLTFTIEVTNQGPSEARNVVITDDLPSGRLTYVSSSVTDPAGSCTETSGTVRCTLDAPLPPNATATVEVVATVEVAAFPSVTNPAEATTTTPETTEGPNRAEDVVTVPAQVDLAIAKTHTDAFVVGQQANYRIAVTNNGPTLDPGPITVVDELPTGLTYVSGTGTGWVCNAVGQTVSCSLPEVLDVDATRVLTLRVAVGPEAAPSVINTATVSSAAEDLNPENNTASDPTEVTPVSKLDIVKELESLRGTRATYTLTVTNTGPNATSAPIVLTDPLPSGLTFVSAGGPDWECGSVAPTVTCTFTGVLEVGDAATVTLVTEVTAAPGQQIVNVAKVEGGGGGGGSATDDAGLTLPPSVLSDTGAGVVGQLTVAVILLALGALIRASSAQRKGALVTGR